MDNIGAKPFVKWAGGKRQLLPEINKNLPQELNDNRIEKYVEPFVGGGAVFFDIISKYKFKQVIINDYNEDLMNLYKHIQTNVFELIKGLEIISKDYYSLDKEDRATYYYKIRDKFNMIKSNMMEKSILFIFLNRTCFNGLYRVNAKGEFNVPHGRYKNPKILDTDNLINVSKALDNVTIISGDFSLVDKYVDDKTFIYFDPPYRPLNNTSSFTSYSSNDFDDNEQIRLANFFKSLDSRGAKLMLSNSDPKNIDPDDYFFDDLYGYSNHISIKRVEAKRIINSKASGRGYISELLITNY